MIWHGNLTDTRKFTYGGQEFYIPVDERELGSIFILFILVPSPRDIFPCVIDANIKIPFEYYFYCYLFVILENNI